MDISLYESIARIYTSDINYDIKNPKNPIIDKSSIGSGFFINPNVIVTCSHVVNKSKTIYVYCLSGSRSNVAVETMVQLGYKKVFSMTSGLLMWRSKKYPLVA